MTAHKNVKVHYKGVITKYENIHHRTDKSRRIHYKYHFVGVYYEIHKLDRIMTRFVNERKRDNNEGRRIVEMT